MNNLKNKSSLILTPNAYKEGTLFNYKPLGTDFTFQRNTTSTRVNKDGLIEVVDNNIPRLDYSNGNCPEILIEPQATNLVRSNYTEPYSDNITTSAEITYFQDSPFSESIPNAVSQGMKPSVGSRRYDYLFSENQLKEGQTYTFSWYTKRLQEPNLDRIGNFGFISPVNIEVEDGSQFQIESNVNGFDRFQINFTVIDETQTSRLRAYYGGVNGTDGVVRILYAGMQIEEGENATSVILTNGTIATRNADIAFINNYSNIFGDKNSRVIELNGQNNIYIDREDFQLPNGRIKLSYEFKDLIKGKELKNLNVNEIKYGERENIKDEYISTIDFNPSLSLIPGKKDIGEITTLIPRESDDFDFQRNTTATYVDKDGLIKTVLANEPRFNYKNGEFDGLLIEPQRTNLRLNSANNLVGLNGGQVLNNQGIAPDGITQYQKLIFGSGINDGCRIGLGDINVSPNTTYTYSFYAISLVGSGNINYRIDTNTTPLISFGDIIISSSTVSRYSFSFTTDSGASSLGNNSRFRVVNNIAGAEFLLWGHQLEEGSTATSYIPTNGTIATRNADNIFLSNAQDLIGQEEGSVYVEAHIENTGFNGNLFQISYDSSNRFSLNIRQNNRWRLLVLSTDFTNISITPNDPIVKGLNKIVIKYKEGIFKFFLNGALIGQQINGIYSQSLDFINLGTGGSPLIPSSHLNNTIKQFSLFKTALTDQQAINLTTI